MGRASRRKRGRVISPKKAKEAAKNELQSFVDELDTSRRVVFVFTSALNGIAQKIVAEPASPMRTKYGLYYVKLSPEKIQGAEYHDNIVFIRTGESEPPWVLSNVMGYVANRQKDSHVYYVDDYIDEFNSGMPIPVMRQFRRAATTTPELAEHLEKNIGLDEVSIIRQFISMDVVDNTNPLSMPFDDDKFNVIWASSNHLSGSLHARLMEEFAKHEEIRNKCRFFHVASGVGTMRKALYTLPLEQYYFDMLPYERLISLEKNMDIYLNPMSVEDIKFKFRHPNIFFEGKSEVKYTHAGAVGSVLLSSHHPSYDRSVKDGETGFLLSNNSKQWAKKLITLVNDLDLMSSIAEKAHDDVRANFDVKARLDDMYNTFVTARPIEQSLIYKV